MKNAEFDNIQDATGIVEDRQKKDTIFLLQQSVISDLLSSQNNSKNSISELKIWIQERLTELEENITTTLKQQELQSPSKQPKKQKNDVTNLERKVSKVLDRLEKLEEIMVLITSSIVPQCGITAKEIKKTFSSKSPCDNIMRGFSVLEKEKAFEAAAKAQQSFSTGEIDLFNSTSQEQEATNVTGRKQVRAIKAAAKAEQPNVSCKLKEIPATQQKENTIKAAAKREQPNAMGAVEGKAALSPSPDPGNPNLNDPKLPKPKDGKDQEEEKKWHGPKDSTINHLDYLHPFIAVKSKQYGFQINKKVIQYIKDTPRRNLFPLLNDQLYLGFMVRGPTIVRDNEGKTTLTSYLHTLGRFPGAQLNILHGEEDDSRREIREQIGYFRLPNNSGFSPEMLQLAQKMHLWNEHQEPYSAEAIKPIVQALVTLTKQAEAEGWKLKQKIPSEMELGQCSIWGDKEMPFTRQLGKAIQDANHSLLQVPNLVQLFQFLHVSSLPDSRRRKLMQSESQSLGKFCQDWIIKGHPPPGVHKEFLGDKIIHKLVALPGKALLDNWVMPTAAAIYKRKLKKVGGREDKLCQGAGHFSHVVQYQYDLIMKHGCQYRLYPFHAKLSGEVLNAKKKGLTALCLLYEVLSLCTPFGALSLLNSSFQAIIFHAMVCPKSAALNEVANIRLMNILGLWLCKNSSYSLELSDEKSQVDTFCRPLAKQFNSDEDTEYPLQFKTVGGFRGLKAALDMGSLSNEKMIMLDVQKEPYGRNHQNSVNLGAKTESKRKPVLDSNSENQATHPPSSGHPTHTPGSAQSPPRIISSNSSNESSKEENEETWKESKRKIAAMKGKSAQKKKKKLHISQERWC